MPSAPAARRNPPNTSKKPCAPSSRSPLTTALSPACSTPFKSSATASQSAPPSPPPPTKSPPSGADLLVCLLQNELTPAATIRGVGLPACHAGVPAGVLSCCYAAQWGRRSPFVVCLFRADRRSLPAQRRRARNPRIAAVARQRQRNLAGARVNSPSGQIPPYTVEERAHQLGHAAANHHDLRVEPIHHVAQPHGQQVGGLLKHFRG